MSKSGARAFKLLAGIVAGTGLIGVGVLADDMLVAAESGQRSQPELSTVESSTQEQSTVGDEDSPHAQDDDANDAHDTDSSMEEDGDHDDSAETGSAERVQLSETALESIGLTTGIVQLGPVETTRRFPGTVRMHPDGIAILSTRIRGKIVEVSAAPGDRVREGQVLASIQSLVPGNPPPTVELRAPITGVVARRDAIVGEAVQPDKELFRLIDPRRVVAEARVPAWVVDRVRLGQSARFHRVRGHEVWTGRVSFIGSEADPTTRTYPVWIELSADGRAPPLPGQFGEILVVQSRRTALTVPQGALVEDGPLAFVFVQRGHAFERRLVRTGVSGTQAVEIVAGVVEGDTVAVIGSYELLLALKSSGPGVAEAESVPHGH